VVLPRGREHLKLVREGFWLRKREPRGATGTEGEGAAARVAFENNCRSGLVFGGKGVKTPPGVSLVPRWSLVCGGGKEV